MIRVFVLLLFAALLTTSCSSPGFAHLPRFKEQEKANLIVRYFSDDTSYVLKPETKQGEFLAVLNTDGVLEMAKRQAGRELAVVVLIHYGADSEARAVKHKWTGLLKEVGYQRVVFLRSRYGMRVDGLPVLASGG